MRHRFLLIALSLAALPAYADPRPSPKVGDIWTITRTQDVAETKSGTQGSSTSFDRDALTERVVAVREGGVELEYDLPSDATAQDRAQDWHLPARIWKPSDGHAQLLNQAELEARVDPWLKAANWTRAICGHWIFTWNAFRIDCEPQTVLEAIAAFDLGPADLREGAPYHEDGGLGTATLRSRGVQEDSAILTVELPVDPRIVRQSEARNDVVVGELTQKPVTLDAAMRAHAAENVSGTISITFTLGATGIVRKATVTSLEITTPDGVTTRRVSTVTLEKRSASPRTPIARSPT